MPNVRIDDTLTLHYELDNYTDPWTTPETLLLIHGVADTSKAWFAWVPQLARRFRLAATLPEECAAATLKFIVSLSR
jgi:pimeloyl-ACP methyl ester carboxylesterase